MIAAAERSALIELVDHFLLSGDQDALNAELRDSGIEDDLRGDAQFVTAMFELNGFRQGSIALWDDHLTRAHQLPGGRLVLPKLGEASPPGGRVAGGIAVDGVVAAPGTQLKVPLEGGGVVSVATEHLDLVPMTGLGLPLELQLVRGLAKESDVFQQADAEWTSLAADLARLVALDLIGVGRAALRAATVHVTDRVQFGRPLGSFQAVRHRLAQAHVGLVGARSLLEATAGSRNVELQRLLVKGEAGRAAFGALAAAQQLCGGMGFTTEFGLGQLVRRAYLIDGILGRSEEATPALGRAFLDDQSVRAAVLSVVDAAPPMTADDD